MPEKGYSQRTKIRDKGSFPKVPDCHGYNSYIGVDPPGLIGQSNMEKMEKAYS